MFAKFLQAIGGKFLSGKAPSEPKAKLIRGGPERAIGGAGLTFREEVPSGGFGAWLKSLVGIKPKEPELKGGEHEVGGHRGKAFGDLQHPDMSVENVREWRGISPKEAEDYLEGALFVVHSTNVREFQYHPEVNKLTAVFDAQDGRGERKYIYSDISRKEMQ